MTVPIAQVGDLCDQIRGVTFTKSESVPKPTPGYLPVLRAGNISDAGLDFDDLLYVPAHRVSAKQLLRRHDVLIAASSGSLSVVGKAARACDDFSGGFGAFCKVLRPNDTVDPVYFSHFFRTRAYRRRISSLAAGANINNLKNGDLNGLEIPLPPLPEQRRIAEILDKADELRAKRRAALATLDTLTQSIFIDMFGDGRDSKYPLQRIEDVVTRLTNGFVGPTRDIYVESGVPYLLARHVKGGRLRFDNKTFISKQFNTKHKKSMLLAGDVLVVQTGHIGESAVVPEIHLGHNCHAMIVITPKEGVLSGPYLSGIFRTDQLRNKFKSIQTGQTLKHLNCRDVKKIEIPVPPLALQESFAQRVREVDRLKASQAADLEGIDQLFSSLQSRAFASTL